MARIPRQARPLAHSPFADELEARLARPKRINARTAARVRRAIIRDALEAEVRERIRERNRPEGKS